MTPLRCAARSITASSRRLTASQTSSRTSTSCRCLHQLRHLDSTQYFRLSLRRGEDSAVVYRHAFRRSRHFALSQRAFSTTPVHRHGHLTKPKPGEGRRVTFIDKEGQRHTFEVADGDNLLDIAQDNDLEMEGACGGSCACSTCHVIVEDEAKYDAMPEPDDDENDMLDLAFGLTETSRLGCQVKMTPELDGLVVKLPSMTRNMQASDFAEKKKD